MYVVVKVLVPTLLVVGCGAAELPQAEVSDTQAEIAAAESVGADAHPHAALHLKRAKDQLKDAKHLAEEGEDELARMALSRARVDAELALALIKEAAAREEARIALQEIAEAQGR